MKRLGRPRSVVDSERIARLRAQGLSWARIGKQTGIGEGTVRRVLERRNNLPGRSEHGFSVI